MQWIRRSYVEADPEPAGLALLVPLDAVPNVGDGLEVGVREDGVIVGQQRRPLEGRQPLGSQALCRQVT